MSVDYEYPAKIIDDFDKHVQEHVEKSIANEKDSEIKKVWKKIFSTKDHYEILELCGQLTLLSPNNFMVDIKKARTYAILKQNGKAEEIFKSVIKKTNGELAKPHLFFGLFLEKIQKDQDALNCFEKAIELDGKDSHIFFHKALALIRLGKHQDGIDCLVKSSKLGEVDNWQIWSSKGIALDGLGKYQDALNCFEKAIELDGKESSIFFHKALALIRLDKHQDALDCLNKAIELDGKNWSFWNNKGIVWGRLGKHQDALDCFEKAIELDGKDLKVFANKGIALDHLDKHQDALDCFEKAIELDGKNGELLSHKALTLIRLDKHQDALDCFEKAIELDVNISYQFLNGKGIALSGLGKHQDALNCFEKAIELDGKEWALWSNKGEVLGKLGKYPDAIRCYEKSLSIKDNDTIRKELENIIKKQNSLQKENTTTELEDNDENPKWTNDPPTEKQLQYIEKLGGDRNAPKSKGEASEMIAKLKEEN